MIPTIEITAPILVGMVIIDFMAFVGNLLNIIAILGASHLRHNLANLLVLNLCIIDILASVLLLPAAIASFVYDTWVLGDVVCTLVGFLGSLLTFASIANICGISIERFYCIKYPMHHAAHMTLTKTVGVISLIWGVSLLISAMPLIGVNSYSYQSFKKQCSFSAKFESIDRIYVIALCLLAFYVPGCILFVMYWRVFLVAHQAGRQIKPEVAILPVPPVENSRVSISGNASRIAPTTNNVTVTRQNHRSRRRHLKAAKTLIVILAAYLMLWGPYFIYHTHVAVQGQHGNRHLVEVLVLWLGYSTFSFNPLLYGFMNRAIRAELLTIYRSIFCCRACMKLESEDEGDAEDFFQFLEGTTTKLAVISSHRPSGLNNQSESSGSGIRDVSLDGCN